MTPVNFFDRTLIRDAFRETERSGLTRRACRFVGEAKGHKRKREQKRGGSVATDETAEVAFFFHMEGVFPQTSLENAGRNLEKSLELRRRLRKLAVWLQAKNPLFREKIRTGS